VSWLNCGGDEAQLLFRRLPGHHRAANSAEAAGDVFQILPAVEQDPGG